MIAIRQIRENGGAMKAEEIYKKAMIASDNHEFAASLWRKAKDREMMKE